MNFSADLAKICRSFELPTDLGRIHAFRAGNLDASLHFTAHISCDSLLIVGPAVYGLNRAIPNDRPQSPPSSLLFLRLCDQHMLHFNRRRCKSRCNATVFDKFRS